MAKVVAERPRGGRGARLGKGYLKDLQRTPVEDRRTREGIGARCRWNANWSRVHLGPLRRFLASNVGRPWDEVHSEVCRELRGDPFVRGRFLSLVERHVERDVILIEGVPCRATGRAWGSPLVNYAGHFAYVCPQSGLLKKVAERSRRKT